MEYKFHTSLNKDECIKRLSNAIRPPRFYDSKLELKYGMVGKVDGQSFSFQPTKIGGGMGGNIIAPKGFVGKIAEAAEGTNITGRLTDNTGRLMLIGGIVILFIIVPQIINSGLISSMIFFLLFFIIALFLYFIRDKGEKSINFIKDTLEAQQVI